MRTTLLPAGEWTAPGERHVQPKVIELKHCRFELWPDCCRTVFADGAYCTAAPEDTDAYRAHALSLGYGADTFRMCVDHEYLHNVVAEALWDKPSPAIWDVAHGVSRDRGYEERIVLTVQRWLTQLNELHAFRQARAASPHC